MRGAGRRLGRLRLLGALALLAGCATSEHWGNQGERVDTYWYSPRIRYWVRLENYVTGYTEELVEFRISPS